MDCCPTSDDGEVGCDGDCAPFWIFTYVEVS